MIRNRKGILTLLFFISALSWNQDSSSLSQVAAKEEGGKADATVAVASLFYEAAPPEPGSVDPKIGFVETPP